MRKFVYLISPKKISSNFYNDLHKVLAAKNVKFFQLRLKKVKINKLLLIIRKIKQITKKHKVRFILNDDYLFAHKIKTDG